MSKKKHPPRPLPESLGLPLTGVDTHAHLDMEPWEDGLDAVLDQARAAGVAAVGNVFLGLDAYAANARLFADRPEVFFILGAHPCDTAGLGSDGSDRLAQGLAAACRADPRIKAVGEIGLDFYWDKSPRHDQEAAFRAQLAVAADLRLPVVIHSRESSERTLKILREEGFDGRPVLWHCFGSGPGLAQAILDRGWHLSVTGAVTYSRNDELREAVRLIPADRLVLETDCPFLAPEPWRGKKNHPALLAFTAQAVAHVRQVPAPQVWSETAQTARLFFGLD